MFLTASGESSHLWNIAKRVSTSRGIVAAQKPRRPDHYQFQEKREERLGDNIFDGIKSAQGKALELLGKMEEQGDYRSAVLAAAREAREALLSANELLADLRGGDRVGETPSAILGLPKQRMQSSCSFQGRLGSGG